MLIPKFAPDDKVFAKLRGYPPWPARVEGFADETPNKIKYHVYFYGTGETAVCKQEELCLYVENKEKYGKPMKKKGFNTALAQIDAELGLGPSLVQNNGMNCLLSSKETPVQSDTNTPITSKNKNSTQRKRKKLEESDTEDSAKKPRHTVVKDEDASETQIPSTSNQQKTSRSGRKITKAKMYSDSEEEQIKETMASSKTKSKTTGNKKVNVDAEINQIKTKGVETTTPEGQKLTLQLTLKKPRYLKSKKELEQWKSKVLLEVEELKSKIESGKISVEEIIEKINVPCNKTLAALQQKKSDPESYEKLNFLNMEVKLIDLNLSIRQAATIENADLDACLRHLDELRSIEIHPLMVKKNPEVVETLRKLTKYVGKTMDYADDEAEIFKSKAEAIREKAKEIRDKIKSLFEIPSGKSLSKVFFFKVLLQFHQAVKGLSLDELVLLSSDPTRNSIKEDSEIYFKSTAATTESAVSNVTTAS